MSDDDPRADVIGRLRTVAESGLGETLAGADARAYVEDLARLVDIANERDQEHLTLFERAVAPAMAAVRAAGQPIAVASGDREYGAGQLLHAEILESLLAFDAPLAVPERNATVPLYSWVVGRFDRDLSHVLAHPELNAMIADQTWRALMTDNAESTVTTLAALSRLPGAEPILAAVADFVGRVAESGTLAAYESWSGALELLCRWELLEACPALRDNLLRLEGAALLHGQLRNGIMDEWGWPALDAAPPLGPRAKTSGSYPYLCRWDPDSGRVDVVGPDGLVFSGRDDGDDDGPALMRYVDGDLALIGTGRWLLGGGSIAWTPASSVLEWGLEPVVPGGIAGPGGVFGRGAADLSAFVRASEDLMYGDGQHAWTVEAHTVAGPDGRGRRLDTRQHVSPPLLARFGGDPASDRNTVRPVGVAGRLDTPGLPPWFAERVPADGTLLCCDASFLVPAPAGAEESPLGAAGGLGGWAVTWHTERGLRGEGTDGRTFQGPPDAPVPLAVFTFPGAETRSAVYFTSGNVLWDVEHRRPLTPRAGWSPRYWSSPLARADLAWWHLLRPRDPAGSVALRRLDPGPARSLWREARAAVERGESKLDDAQPVDMSYPDLGVIRYPAPKAVQADAWPSVLAAVRLALPDVTHPELVAAVARMAVLAAGVEPELARLRERAAMASRGGARSSLTNGNARALGDLLGYDTSLWWNRPEHPLGQQVLDAGDFLFSDRPAVPASQRPATATPAVSSLPWELLVERLPEVLWRILAAGTPEPQRAQLVAIAQLWLFSGFADGPVRLVDMSLPPLSGLDFEHPVRLAEWDTRWFLRYQEYRDGRLRVRGIEAACGGEFVAPPGAEIRTDTRPRVTRAAIERVLALLAERGPVPASPAAGREIAERTGLLPSTASLLWTAARGPWDNAESVRAALGLSPAELAAGQAELGGFDPSDVYVAGWPDDPEHLYSGAAADRLGQAWNDTFGWRPAVATEWVTQADADLAGLERDTAYDLRILLDPDHRPLVTTEHVWVVRPYEAFGGYYGDFSMPPGWPKPSAMGLEAQYPDREWGFSGFVLRRFVPYLAWAYAALPGGHPLRDGAAVLASRIAERLRNPDLMLLGGAIDLSGEPDRFPDLAASLDGPPYRAADGGAAATGVDRGDLVLTWPTDGPNGAYIAVRPGRITDEARLLDGLRRLGVLPCGPFTAVAAGDTYAWLVFRSAGFQALCAGLRGGPKGRYAADPRVSVPSLVAEVMNQNDLSEDAAALYLQVITLLEQTPELVCRVNGWTPDRYDTATAPLVQAGLLVEANHSKETLYLFEPTGGHPLHVQLPLRPYEDLFRSAYLLRRS